MFREFGPVAGSTVRLSYDVSPNAGNLLSYQTVDFDARKYLRIGTSGLFALRFKGFKSWGENPDFDYFGGNSRDARLRVPLVRRSAGLLRQRGAALPADRGDAHAGRRPRRHPRRHLRQHRRRRLPAARTTSSRRATPITLRPVVGFAPVAGRLRRRRSTATRSRSRASACRTAGRPTASASRASCSGSRSTSTTRGGRPSTSSGKTCSSRPRAGAAEFRKGKFHFWIGYDF